MTQLIVNQAPFFQLRQLHSSLQWFWKSSSKLSELLLLLADEIKLY
jgi:hypothetical protein